MRVGLGIPMHKLRPGTPRRYSDIREIAVLADDRRIDSVWFGDHLLSSDPSDLSGSPWETWTVLSAISAVTQNIELGTLVLCHAFRSPGVLGRMADTLQEVSSGRLVLGLGAGWNVAEFDAFGLPSTRRVERFEEYLKVITALLRDSSVTFHGRHYDLEGAGVRVRSNRPVPPILVAGEGPRMLSLTARYADAWNCGWYGLPGFKFDRLKERLAESCRAIGRDIRTLFLTVGVRVSGSADSDLDRLACDVGSLVDALRAWQKRDVETLIFWFEQTDVTAVESLAEAVREFGTGLRNVEA